MCTCYCMCLCGCIDRCAYRHVYMWVCAKDGLPVVKNFSSSFQLRNSSFRSTRKGAENESDSSGTSGCSMLWTRDELALCVLASIATYDKHDEIKQKERERDVLHGPEAVCELANRLGYDFCHSLAHGALKPVRFLTNNKINKTKQVRTATRHSLIPFLSL